MEGPRKCKWTKKNRRGSSVFHICSSTRGAVDRFLQQGGLAATHAHSNQPPICLHGPPKYGTWSDRSSLKQGAARALRNGPPSVFQLGYAGSLREPLSGSRARWQGWARGGLCPKRCGGFTGHDRLASPSESRCYSRPRKPATAWPEQATTVAE